MQSSQLDLLVLELELRAGDGSLEFGCGFVAEGLVYYVFIVAAFGGVVRGLGDGGELKGKGELEVGFSNDFGIFRIQLFLVCKGGAAIGDGIRESVKGVALLVCIRYRRASGL